MQWNFVVNDDDNANKNETKWNETEKKNSWTEEIPSFGVQPYTTDNVT